MPGNFGGGARAALFLTRALRKGFEEGISWGIIPEPYWALKYPVVRNNSLRSEHHRGLVGFDYSSAIRSQAISRCSSLSPVRRAGGDRIMRSPSKRTPRT